MDKILSLHKVFHLLIDRFILNFEKSLDSNEFDKTKVYLEVIKRSSILSRSIRAIALNLSSYKCSDIPVSEDEIQNKMSRLVENSLQQDLIEYALDSDVSTNVCPTKDDLHSILFKCCVTDSTSIVPSLMHQVSSGLFENKMLLCNPTLLFSPTLNDALKNVDSVCLSNQFEGSQINFECEVSQLRYTLGTGLSMSDIKVSDIPAKAEKLINGCGDLNMLPKTSEVQKEPSEIADWLVSGALSNELCGRGFDDSQLLNDVPSSISTWEDRMRQLVPCHLYTSELSDKEMFLNINEEDSGMYRVLYEPTGVQPESDFVHDLLDLLVGIPSCSFLYEEKVKCFRVKPFIRLAKLSNESTSRFCEKFIESGSTFYKLKSFCSTMNPKEGLILKGLKNGIHAILSAYMEYITSIKMNNPTMLMLRTDVSKNAEMLNCLGGICGIYFEGSVASELPKGLGLLSYLNKISWSHRTRENSIMVAVLLKYAYSPYFSFLNKWMEEGVCCDPYDEFQIEEDLKYLDRKDDLYWKFAYTEYEDESIRMVPPEIKKFSQEILQCGKSMRLLRNCGLQLSSLDYMSCHPPPCLSMVFSYHAVNARMEECELYIQNKESFELNQKYSKQITEDQFYIKQQTYVTQNILANQIEKRCKQMTVFASPPTDLTKERIYDVALRRCRSFPCVALKNRSTFSGISYNGIGVLFSSCGYSEDTIVIKDFSRQKNRKDCMHSRKFGWERNMNYYSTVVNVQDQFVNTQRTSTEIISLKQVKQCQNFAPATELHPLHQTEFPSGSFMDCLISLLVSEYEDAKEHIYSFLQLISLQNLVQYNFRDVLNLRLHLVQESIMDYVINQLRLEDLLLCLRNLYFLQDESFSQHLCKKLFKWVMKCTSLGEFADWSVLNRILSKAIAIPSFTNISVLESASVNFVPIPEEYLSKRNKFLQFFHFEFQIAWPLNIIVHKACITQYISILSFILEMEFLCWVLGKIWRSFLIDAKSEALQKSPQYKKVMLHRFNMHQFVRVLRNCIHQDLGGPLWESLVKSLHTKELSIDALEDIHLRYLERALERCFLTQDTSHLHEVLELLLKQVNTFCDAALNASWKMNPVTNHFESLDFPLLSDCYERYTKCKDHFYEFISKILSRKRFKSSWDEHYQLYLETILETGKNMS